MLFRRISADHGCWNHICISWFPHFKRPDIYDRLCQSLFFSSSFSSSSMSLSQNESFLIFQRFLHNFLKYFGLNLFKMDRKANKEARGSLFWLLLLDRDFSTNCYAHMQIRCHLRFFSAMAIKPLNIWTSWILLEVTKNMFETLTNYK